MINLSAAAEPIVSVRTRLVLLCIAALALAAALPTSAAALQFVRAPDSPFLVGSEEIPDFATGDLNGDERDDAVTVNWGPLGEDQPSYSVMLANANGSLTPTPGGPVELAGDPYRVALGHFDAGGDLDMAISMDSEVDVYLGNGDGTFSAAPVSSLTAGASPRAIAAADLDGDARDEIVVANYASNDVSVFHPVGEDGDEFVQPEGSPYPVGSTEPTAIAVGDLDGDGDGDIATANRDGLEDRSITVLLAGEAGTYAPAPGSPLEGLYRTEDVAIGHVDADENLDLVSVSSPNNYVVVKLGDGEGGFSDAPGGPFEFPGRYASSLALADFDGNGRDEVAIPLSSSIGEVADNTAWIFEANAEGSLSTVAGNPFSVWPGSAPGVIAAGDFNGDDVPDLATETYNDNLMVLLRNDEPQPYPAIEPGWLEFGDEYVGESSEPQELTIANEGSGPLSLLGIALSGEDPDQFAIDTSDCGVNELEPGEECTVEATFAPTGMGSKSASLRLPRPLGPPAAITFYGYAEDVASAEISPTEHDFGGQLAGEGASTPRTFNVESTSEAPFEIESVSLAGPDAGEFELSYDECSGYDFWEANDWCEIDVEFNPWSVGEKSAELVVESEDLEAPLIATLSGSGEPNPGIAVSPTEWDAGSAPVGSADGPTERFAVLNYGTTPLELETVGLKGPNPGEFGIVVDECSGQSVQPWDECEVEVEFAPGSTGLKEAVLEFRSNAPGSPEIALLEGTGEGVAAATLTPTEHDFGAVPYKTESAGQAFTLENTGTEPLHVTSVGLTNTVDGFEIVDDDCTGVILAAGQGCAVEVTLSPQVFGPISGELEFETDAPSVSPSATLSGSASDNPGIAMTPASHDFGGRLIDAGQSAPQQFIVESTGTTSLLLGMPGLAGVDTDDFALDASDCDEAGSLQPGETCVLAVSFDPRSTGAKAVELVMFSDAGERRATLSGTGQERKLEVLTTSSGTGDVPVGSTFGPLEAGLQNAGTLPVDVESVELTGGDVSQFEIVDGCEGELAPSTACYVRVNFEPTEIGLQEAELTIEADAPGGPWTVDFYGTGAASPGIAMTPASHDFGNLIVGAGPSTAQAFTVESTGTTPLNLGTIELAGTDPGEFGLVESCPASLEPEATCEVQVSFDPTSEGQKSAELSVASDASGGPVTAGISGFGVAPEPKLEIAPSSHEFGAIAVGSSGPAVTFTAQSTGNVPVTIPPTGGLAISGLDAGDFDAVAAGCAGDQLAPGEACDVEIAFAPLTIGTKQAELLVYSDAGGPPAATAGLTGIGLPSPGIAVEPSALAFGSRTVGDGPGAPRTVTIESTGATPAEVDGLGFKGSGRDQFQLAGNECFGGELAPGERCEVAVAFAPVAAGAHEAELEILFGGGADSTTVALSGTGVAKQEPPAPPAPPTPTPAPPACTVPEVKRPTAFVPRVKETPRVPGLRARFGLGAPAVLEVSARVRYRANGKARTASLGKQALRPGGSAANYKVAIPGRLREALPPGTAVRLELRYRSRGAESACTAFGPASTRNLATKVVWIKPAG